MSIVAAHTSAHPMSGGEFRAFQATRPDHERWELIKGLPVMMVPPTISHQRIAGNLERLLLDALAIHDPTRTAVQGSGVELGDVALEKYGEDYRPEPDVIVLDADYDLRQRFVARAYLLAEIVSDTDYQPVPGEKEPWIAIKRRLYLAHQHCEAVVLVDPYRIELKTDIKTENGWISGTLTQLDQRLTIPSCGLTCMIADVYRGTPLNRHRLTPKSP